jgi:acyl-CoA thioesterase-1
VRHLAKLIPALFVAASSCSGRCPTPAQDAPPAVVFFGDSLTAGQGVSSEEAFPALLAARMRAAGIELSAVNLGKSGETTAGGLSRLDCVLDQRPAVLVLELGVNDGLMRVSLDRIARNLAVIIERAQAAGARVLLVGMKLPLTYDPAYRNGFEKVYADLAGRYRVAFLPFLLEGVGGVPRLNQGDGLHPTAEGYRVVASVVWPALEPLLGGAQRKGR